MLSSNVYVVRYASADRVHEVPLAHGVDRIEALGSDAVVVGTDGENLHFTTLGLTGAPAPADRYTQKDAAQGETRSHGFFYRQERGAEGVIGLPVVGRGEPASRQLRQESAAVLFLRNRSLQLTGVGALESRPDTRGLEDGCRASCVDWYGNSRPLFVRDRVFALMGYEIVEGALQADRINETRRINFAPR